MMLKNKILSALGGEEAEPLYVDDVFSTYLYNGNGGSQTITNGIDLAGKGGMVWMKNRGSVVTHSLLDTARGTIGGRISSSSTDAQAGDISSVFVFNNAGFSFTNFTNAENNAAGAAYVSWTFRKAPKFFDVVTYTGTGVAQSIPHSLGIAPGMVIVKRTNATANWAVYHRSHTSAAYYSKLNLVDAPVSDGTVWNSAAPTDAAFTVGSSALTNTNGATYVAYLFAHDTSADGIVRCGSYTGNGSATGPVITLGWEPQYLLIKNASSTGNWQILDNLRGMPVGSAEATLQADLAVAETAFEHVSPTATGFQITSTSSNANASGNTYVYMAIRRSNKPPSSGTDVFMPTVYGGTNTDNRFLNTGILADMVWLRYRAGSSAGYEGLLVGDRLRGNAFLKTGDTAAEVAVADGLDAQLVSAMEYGNAFSSNSGIYIGNNTGATVGSANINANTTASGHVALAFKRAVGVFDTVCRVGTGVATPINHNLGVTPELIICKSVSNTMAWYVNIPNQANTLCLDSNAAQSVTPARSANKTTYVPVLINSGYRFVDYLFASKPGISKVGSYTGNGGSQTIDCGFTTGTRFVLIKRTDSLGYWYVFDTARGISTGNDPFLYTGLPVAEVTTDDILDPSTSGFVVNQLAATNINLLNGTYIFLALA